MRRWRRKPGCPEGRRRPLGRPGRARRACSSSPGRSTVPDWPTPIDSGNVVNVTLRDAYAQFAATPDRADFLGDVAKAAVDEATAGTLGKPAQIAKVLGGAAHSGHLILGFTRPNEEALADQLGVSGRLDPVRSDAIAVTSSNFGRQQDRLLPEPRGRLPGGAPAQPAAAPSADASANLVGRCSTTPLPPTGLPQIVIGPYLQDRFVAGENRTLLSMYSPLHLPARDRRRQARFDRARARARTQRLLRCSNRCPRSTQKSTTTKLAGPVQLHEGWYTLQRPCASRP